MSDDDPKSRPPSPTRRKFLVTSGSSVAASLVAGYVPALAKEAAAVSDSALADARPNMEGAVPITLRINGKEHSLRIDPRTTLLDCIRETVALTGTKKGCDHGQCGACTVHVNGRRVVSCLTLALLHDGYQCGYCTSGQIMSAVALLKEPCGPDDAAVKELMSGNICRCGAYPSIVAAIQHVRKNT